MKRTGRGWNWFWAWQVVWKLWARINMTQFAIEFASYPENHWSNKKLDGSFIGLICQATGGAKVGIIDPVQIAYLGTEFDTFILCNKFGEINGLEQLKQLTHWVLQKHLHNHQRSIKQYWIYKTQNRTVSLHHQKKGSHIHTSTWIFQALRTGVHSGIRWPLKSKFSLLALAHCIIL